MVETTKHCIHKIMLWSIILNFFCLCDCFVVMIIFYDGGNGEIFEIK